MCDTHVESLHLQIGDRIAIVGIAAPEHADGMIWDFGPEPVEGAPDAGHPLRALFDQFAQEDRALTPDSAAPSLDLLLDRLEALLL